MDIASLVHLIDHPREAADRLSGWGLRDSAAGWSRFTSLAEHGLTLDLLASLFDQLSGELSATDDPDEVLAALVDFVAASRSPLALVALFERDRQALPMLLRVLGLGPTWRRLVVADPEAFDLLRMTDGQPVTASWLRSEVCAEMAHFSDERHILANLRRIKQRELLRIVYGDVHKRQRFELVTEQLTILADALLEAAIQAARRKLQERSDPRRTSAAAGRFSIIALGRLGGFEMDYSHQLELLLVHEPLPDDEHARRAAKDYFDRLARLVVRFLAEPFDGHAAYEIATPIQLDNQPRPAAAADEVVSYLDRLGRTWHREAMIKARAVAGDMELAGQVLRQLQPWVFRRYLNRADETGTRALKRRLQRHMAVDPGLADAADEVATMTRHLEGVARFLQLLSGGDQPIVRASNTLAAIAGLEQAGVLAVQERIALEDDYRRLREAEHRRQIALSGLDPAAVAGEVREALRRAQETTSQLLASAFPSDASPPAEVDLLLDPQPTDSEIKAVLDPYGFRDSAAAYHYLQALASEGVPYLSTRRCRYFLSTIAPQLLAAVAATPDPDSTLANLSQVSDSIGGKGVLWELFSFHPPSLQLYVKLCAASPYLSNILTSHPGMVDELVDSLQLARLPTREELSEMLDELLRGDREPLALLHGFKHSHHLQIGVRELLGKDPIETTQQALTDVAEVCLRELVRLEYDKLVEKFGVPMRDDASAPAEPCRFTVLATGKFGGEELNYQSEVELIVVYEADGMTQLTQRGRREAKTANGHFFSQLAQRVAKTASQLTPWGRLYHVETPWQSAGGGLAMSLAALQERAEAAASSLGDWQTLCKARPIVGDPAFRKAAAERLRELLPNLAGRVAELAARPLERTADDAAAASIDVEQAPGGVRELDHFIATWQTRHAAESPGILLAGADEALSALRAAGHLSAGHAEALQGNFRWLRQIDSALRLLHAEPRHELPTDDVALRKLALLLRCESADEVQTRTLAALRDNRERFESLMPLAEQSPEASNPEAAMP